MGMMMGIDTSTYQKKNPIPRGSLVGLLLNFESLIDIYYSRQASVQPAHEDIERKKKEYSGAIFINYIFECASEKRPYFSNDGDKKRERAFIDEAQKYLVDVCTQFSDELERENQQYTCKLLEKLEILVKRSGTGISYELESKIDPYRPGIISAVHDVLGEVSLYDIGSAITEKDVAGPLRGFPKFKEYRHLRKQIEKLKGSKRKQ